MLAGENGVLFRAFVSGWPDLCSNETSLACRLLSFYQT
jgi:hypothetical protein